MPKVRVVIATMLLILGMSLIPAAAIAAPAVPETPVGNLQCMSAVQIVELKDGTLELSGQTRTKWFIETTWVEDEEASVWSLKCSDVNTGTDTEIEFVDTFKTSQPLKIGENATVVNMEYRGTWDATIAKFTVKVKDFVYLSFLKR